MKKTGQPPHDRTGRVSETGGPGCVAHLAGGSTGGVRFRRRHLADDLHIQRQHRRAAGALVAWGDGAGQSRRDAGGIPPGGRSERDIGVRRIGDDDGRGHRAAAGGYRARAVVGAWGAAVDDPYRACDRCGGCGVLVSRRHILKFDAHGQTSAHDARNPCYYGKLARSLNLYLGHRYGLNRRSCF